jgi:uncharacterized membrane protein
VTLLVTLTVVATALLVVLVAGYLIAVAVRLMRANRHLWQLAEGLEGIEANTRNLGDRLRTINGANMQLVEGLRKVDAHLRGVAVMLRM